MFKKIMSFALKLMGALIIIAGLAGLVILTIEEIDTIQDLQQKYDELELNYQNRVYELDTELLEAKMEAYKNSLQIKVIDHTNYINNSEVEINNLDINIHVSKEDLIALAKMIWGETRLVRGFYQTLSDGTQRYVTNTEQIAATVWTVLNRIDAGIGNSIVEVVVAENQYKGYNINNPVVQDYLDLACDCIIRWELEKALEPFGVQADTGRVLPKPTEIDQWCWFVANEDTTHNIFRSRYSDGVIYDWSLETPYIYDMPIY